MYKKKAKLLLDFFPRMISRLVRASRGLDEEDAMLGVIDKTKLQETTRTLNYSQAKTHALMRYFAKQYNLSMGHWNIIADELDRYAKTIEGKNWDFIVALQQAKAKIEAASQTVTVQSVPEMQEKMERKKHFWNRKKSEA